MVLTDQFTTGVAGTRCQILTTYLASGFLAIDTDLITYYSTRCAHSSIAHLTREEWFSLEVTDFAGVAWLIEHDEMPPVVGVW
jgi:hypothetical protein